VLLKLLAPLVLCQLTLLLGLLIFLLTLHELVHVLLVKSLLAFHGLFAALCHDPGRHGPAPVLEHLEPVLLGPVELLGDCLDGEVRVGGGGQLGLQPLLDLWLRRRVANRNVHYVGHRTLGLPFRLKNSSSGHCASKEVRFWSDLKL
jgi:hypothetical protein